MRFQTSFLDEIRDRVPISSVIGPRVSWDRKKTNAAKGDWWACCPFHGEKSPSFHCEDRKGRYHCFGCGVSGDHFRFLTELDGMGFPEAVERIAAMAGVPMPARDPEAEAREKQRATLFDVMEIATAFFEAKLQEATGAKARAYLRDRGLSAATQQSFRLGYAPDSRNALKEHLAAKGVGKDQIEACGLVVFGPDIPVSYDRFRDRIMFPIPDSRGRIIAFGGRAMASDVPAKYLNSPETVLFHKGRVLYNFARARTAAQKNGQLLIVEGYMDVIALHQAGIQSAVAPLGTALTEDQLDLLLRTSNEPVFCFDGDDAGKRAAHRAVDLILPKVIPGITARFAVLPDAKDPDDMIRQEGKEAFLKFLATSAPLHEFFIVRRRAEMAIDTPEQKVAFEKQLLADINRIKDLDVRRQYISHYRLRAAEAFYNKSRQAFNYSKKPIGIKLGEETHIIRVILGLCVEYPGLLSDFVEEISLIEYSNEVYAAFSRELRRLYIEFGPKSVADIYDKIDPKFYFVLENIHGSEKEKEIKSSDGRILLKYNMKRGHRLRSIFPLIRHDPQIELVKMTVILYLSMIQLEKSKREFREEAAEMDADALVLRSEDVRRQEDEVGRLTKDVDTEFQLLAGRNSIVDLSRAA
jgi:DNA primase catalytic core